MARSHCPLHGLPIEIHTLILLQLDSGKSLSALIHASPYLFAVFLSAKEKILSACLQREVDPQVLPIALVAAEAHSLPRGPDRTTVVNTLQHLDELEAAESMKAEEYKFNLDQESDASFISNPLSSTERGRLQRAFLSLELYSHLFHSEPWQDSTFTASEQSSLFFDRLPSWQKIELACVHEYLRDRLGNIFDEVENIFVNRVREETAKAISEKTTRFDNFCSGPHVDSASDCELCASSGSEDMSESDSESDTMSDIDSDDDISCKFSLPPGYGADRFDYEDIFWARLTKGRGHMINMEYMISLGLKFFNELFLADSEKRFKIVVASAKYGGDFLAKSLRAGSGHHMVVENMGTEQEEEIPWDQSLEFHGDKLSAPNLAWLWSHGFTQGFISNRIDDLPHDRFLRSWGYSLWDATRMQSLHILDRNPHDLSIISNYHKHPRSKELSAEFRIKRLEMH
ncbi:hypothetical protein MMC26_007565 [Xylographa opegraphella]|nr:hypothetical protein [Xylographa opegraphella]